MRTYLAPNYFAVMDSWYCNSTAKHPNRTKGQTIKDKKHWLGHTMKIFMRGYIGCRTKHLCDKRFSEILFGKRCQKMAKVDSKKEIKIRK
jgi:hypothetical protein